MGILVKIRDDMEGTIGPDDRIKSKSLTQADREKLDKGREIASKILENMGARDIWSSRPSAAHPGGTCRIGLVVNSDLETRLKTLFVVDASVIPEPWGLPPTLTITALARRLSRHLEGVV